MAPALPLAPEGARTKEQSLRPSRRELLAGGIGAGLLLGSRAAAAQRGLAGSAIGVPPYLVAETSLALARHERAIWTRNIVAIADFGLPSSMPRFHLVDLLAGTTTSLLVTHGKGSDPEHKGLLQDFSDVVGSNATAEGAYLTGEAYSGIHGLSRRLIGLDPTNAHAEERAIVIHSAWYAEPDLVASQGKLGRSDGCFVFGSADLATVLARLGRGRLLYVGRAPSPGA